MTDVLIGIPTCRRPDLLERLLASIAAQRDLEAVHVELFVADNDPGLEGLDLCRSLARHYRWKLGGAAVATPGISAARNAILAAGVARGMDFIAMLDDDEVAEPSWLSELLRQQSLTGADIIGGPVLYQFETPLSRDAADSGAFPLKRRPSGPIDLLEASGNVLISCAALRRIERPTFDDRFGLTGGEDKEFFLRAAAAGLTFAWSNDAVAWESVPVTRTRSEWILRRAFRVGNADARIMKLHGHRGALNKALAKAALVVAAAPLCAPVLLLPGRRLWLLRKWYRAAGKFAAVGGHAFAEYEVASSRGDERGVAAGRSRAGGPNP